MSGGVEVRKASRKLTVVEGDLFVEDSEVIAELEAVNVSGGTECHGYCSFLGSLLTEYLEGRRGDVQIKGNLDAKKYVNVKGNLDVSGHLHSDRLHVRQRVLVGGAFDVSDVNVGGALEISGQAKADKVSVGGSLRCGSDVDFGRVNVGGTVNISGSTKSERIDVGGVFRGDGKVISDDIDVGGTFEAGEVSVGKIDVGGTAKIGGGQVTRKVDVGGTFRSSGPLIFNIIDVGGTVSLSGGKGEDIEVGGKLVSEGSLTFNRLRAGGTIDINGDAVGKRIDVGGTLNVNGSIRLSEQLKAGGRAEAQDQIEADSIQVGGSLSADVIRVLRTIEVSKLMTSKGAKAKRIEIRRRGAARGPIIGEEVTIKEDAEVEDVWGDVVVLMSGARARNIYAGVFYAEAGSDVTGSILFTRELRAERGCRFQAQPTKADKLPEPPL